MDGSAQLSFRDALQIGDIRKLGGLVAETGAFSTEEASAAREYLHYGYRIGSSCCYKFLVGERNGRIKGYACYAQIAGTIGSYEVYWIAVRKKSQGKGIGRMLMKEVEDRVHEAGGKRLYFGVSSRAGFRKAHLLCGRMGYEKVAVHSDYFDIGEDKVYYMKRL